MELYRTAAQPEFVAGFIGSPKMNFIEGEEAAKHGAKTIGIRPEHIAVSETEGEWSGVVSVAEHLGSDTFFHVHDTGLAETITVRADRRGWVPPRRSYLPDAALDDVIHRFDANRTADRMTRLAGKIASDHWRRARHRAGLCRESLCRQKARAWPSPTSTSNRRALNRPQPDLGADAMSPLNWM